MYTGFVHGHENGSNVVLDNALPPSTLGFSLQTFEYRAFQEKY